MSYSLIKPNFNEIFSIKSSFWQVFLLSFLATVIWRIYYPGLMSPDSIDQYGQAYFGSFVDWHPPLMSIVLRLVMKLGGGIGSLILFQCFAAVFGLRNLLSLALRFFSDQKALSAHPSKFLFAKFFLFERMLSSDYWFKQKLAYDIIGNPYGLKINEEFSPIRWKINALSEETANNWYFIWLSGIHLLWLALNILVVIYYLIKLLMKKDKYSLLTLLLFLIPFSYYFSYLLAATTPDYRFMYPATLIMQCLIVSILLIKCLDYFNKIQLKH